MTDTTELEPLDLRPSPRVLRMLGRIDFKPWQCLAELIDNAVDAFLEARETGDNSSQWETIFPQVNIELSATSDLRASRGELRVVDNGPGMSSDFLQDAVRAGFSTSDAAADKLGLFGMGFNVATARLGSKTEVWTTRRDDDYWFGVRIDFDDMERSGSFAAPALRRPKTTAESGRHGSEIVVSKLDVARALYLRSGGGLRSTRDRLSRVYNKIMRDTGLQVVLVGTPLTSREFCIWGDERYVETKSEVGRVPARIPIQADLGARDYCGDCWVWLDDRDRGLCPSCGKPDRVRQRERKVSGWLGIQRFFDQTDYGVDLIRNGRVIEERSKVFFSWRNPETDDSLVEYPLEQTHWGGRIVGELNLDFVPLASHQKDAFDKTTSEWRLVEEVVRGAGPIIAKYRRLAGFLDRNLSPLARLHAAYRRGQPAGLRTLVPGDDKGRGFNVPAQQWAANFWEGEADYQSDEKWYQAVLVAERANTQKKGAEVPDEMSGAAAFPTGELQTHEPDDLDESGLVATADEPEPAPPYDVDPSLSQIYELRDLPGAPRLEVTAQQLLTGKLPQDRPISIATVASRVEFIYNPKHATFVESLVEPVDCLIEELGYQFLARGTATQPEWPLSIITRALRDKYFPWTVNTYAALRDESRSLLDEMIEFFIEALAALPGQHAENISDDERKVIAHQVAIHDHQGGDRVSEVIERGEYPRYLGHPCLVKLLRLWPELILDGAFFSNSYSDVDRSAREHIVDDIATCLGDAIWVANPDGLQGGSSEWRARLARSASSLRLLQTWKVTS